MSWNHLKDGITHLNVYSKAQTELGRFLSNFAHCQISTADGNFESIEGYWYWLGTNHPYRDELRLLYGWKAKQVGRQFKAVAWHGEDWSEFQDKIRDALRIKLYSRPDMMMNLLENTLPLTHYYVHYGRVIEPPGNEWIMEFFESFHPFE